MHTCISAKSLNWSSCIHVLLRSLCLPLIAAEVAGLVVVRLQIFRSERDLFFEIHSEMITGASNVAAANS